MGYTCKLNNSKSLELIYYFHNVSGVYTQVYTFPHLAVCGVAFYNGTSDIYEYAWFYPNNTGGRGSWDATNRRSCGYNNREYAQLSEDYKTIIFKSVVSESYDHYISAIGY